MLISDVTLNGVYVVDVPSIITTGALMYVDAGQTSSYPGTGTTNSNTWVAQRISHIFIGVKS